LKLKKKNYLKQISFNFIIIIIIIIIRSGGIPNSMTRKLFLYFHHCHQQLHHRPFINPPQQNPSIPSGTPDAVVEEA